MSRQSISLTQPNDEWLKQQVESQEYTSKSELVNDLIRQARKQQAEIDWLKLKLEKAEKSGFTGMSPAEILAESKARLNADSSISRIPELKPSSGIKTKKTELVRQHSF